MPRCSMETPLKQVSECWGSRSEKPARNGELKLVRCIGELR